MRQFILTFALVILGATNALAHCEIPCGVFDDGARFDSIMEHIETIEKSMDHIRTISAEEPVDYHMITRWTISKEEHAQKIQDIAAQYFLTQRVKMPVPDAAEAEKNAYIKHTTLLHELMVAAMKAKQTTDIAAVEKLRDVTESYRAHYFEKHGHTH
jgi:nickel superoxide dismutase